MPRIAANKLFFDSGTKGIFLISNMFQISIKKRKSSGYCFSLKRKKLFRIE